MNVAKATPVSPALEQDIINVALLPINDVDLERLELEGEIKFSRLKIAPSHTYLPLVSRIVSEVVSYDMIVTERS